MSARRAARRSIDDLLAEARARLDRVEPSALAAEFAAGAVVIDIRPVEQRTRDGAIPSAIVIDRNVLEWRLDPASEHRIGEIGGYDTRIVIVCNEGYQSSLVAAELRMLGLHRATDLIGGFQAWIGEAVPMTTSNADDTRIARLVGVYDADGTLRGELAYWVGARLGRRHCSLCAITHGSVRERPEWNACRAGLPVAFDTFHRDDQPDPIRTVAGGRAPVVVADTDRGPVLLLGPDELDACGGSIDRLVAAIEHAASARALAWPSPTRG